MKIHAGIFPQRMALIVLSVLLASATVSAQSNGLPVVVTYSYPLPNSIQVSAKTTIGVRFAESLVRSTVQNNAFSVLGTASGMHSGKVTLALDNRTLIFTPDKIFYAGERVIVNMIPIKCGSGKSTVPYSFSFTIAKSKYLPSSLGINPKNPSGVTAAWAPSGRAPWLSSAAPKVVLPGDFPNIHLLSSNNPTPGTLYLANYTFGRNDSGNYMMILDNSGHVLFDSSSRPAFSMDFRPQPNGLFTYFDANPFAFKFFALDSTFAVVDSFEAANGYSTDSHELIFLPDGGFALLAQVDQMIDMRSVVANGDSNTTVAEGIVQRFDAAKNLIFEWRTTDHFLFSDPTHEDLASSFVDLTHCNSLEYDFDSTFLLSSRSLDEVTKIDPETGKIIWRLGGKHNQFTMLGDTLAFSYQHDVRRLPNGNISMFDNGKFHTCPEHFSRAVEYKLDETAKTATKVWEYRHTPDLYGDVMGSVQQLPNGNKLIGWGACDSAALTEIHPDGSVALEIAFDPGIYSYRAFKSVTTSAGVSANTQSLSPAIRLEQNYPNPVSTSTVISFSLTQRLPVRLTIYDELGREIRQLFNGTVDAGTYSAKFDASNIPSGAYICTLSSENSSVSKEIIVAK